MRHYNICFRWNASSYHAVTQNARDIWKMDDKVQKAMKGMNVDQIPIERM